MATIFYTAPTAIRALMQGGDEPVKKTSRKSLRLLGSVGEPINPEAWLWYWRTVGEEKCAIVDTWWQTETGGIMIANYAAEDVKPGSMGRPLPGITAAIVRRLKGGAVEVVAGASSRRKTVRITGVAAAAIEALLDIQMASAPSADELVAALERAVRRVDDEALVLLATAECAAGARLVALRFHRLLEPFAIDADVLRGGGVFERGASGHVDHHGKFALVVKGQHLHDHTH